MGAMTVVIPESVLKKRKRQEKWQQKQSEVAAAASTKGAQKKQEIFKRAETYIQEYRNKEKQLVHMKRAARSKGTFYVEPEAKLLFVMRVNKATMNMLVKVDPYIMYGYPNLKTVRDLVYKRGFAKINGQRVPITDNDMIEEALGEKTKGAIICMEDLVHEIYTVGPFFKECTKFLWPFKMNNPVGGFSRIRHHFVEGGDAGNREEYVNELIRRML